MGIEHRLDGDIPARLHPGLRISQRQDGGERTAVCILPAVHLAARRQHQFAAVGVILAAQQIAAGLHAYISTAGLHQPCGIGGRGRHACLGGSAGGDIFHVAAGSERDIAAAQRAYPLLELVETHPPGRLGSVNTSGSVQLTLAEQPVGIKLRRRRPDDIASRGEADIAPPLAELSVGRHGKVRHGVGRPSGGVDRRLAIGQGDVAARRDADVAGTGAHQPARSQRDIARARLHRQRIGRIDVRPGHQPVAPGIPRQQRGRRGPAAERGGDVEAVGQIAIEVEVACRPQGQHARFAARAAGAQVPVIAEREIAAIHRGIRTHLHSGTHVEDRVAGLAQARGNGACMGGKAVVVGIDRIQAQRGAAARAAAGERGDVIINPDRFHHHGSGPADAAAGAAHRHLIARTGAGAGRAQHYLAAFAWLGAVASIATTHIQRAARGKVQPARRGADFHLAAVSAAAGGISVEPRARQQRHVATGMQIYAAASAVRGVDMPGHVQLAAIHRDANLLGLDGIGRSHDDIAAAYSQRHRAIEPTLIERRVQRGEVRQRAHIQVGAPALTANPAGIRRGHAPQAAGGDVHAATGGANRYLARVAPRRRRHIHARAGLQSHVAVAARQFDGAARRGAAHVEKGHGPARHIGYRMRAQSEIARGRSERKLARRQRSLGIEQHFGARQRPLRPQRGDRGKGAIRRQGSNLQWTGNGQGLVTSPLAADTRDIQVRRSGGDIGSASAAPDQLVRARIDPGKSLGGLGACAQHQRIRLECQYAAAGSAACRESGCRRIGKHDIDSAQRRGPAAVVQANQSRSLEIQGLERGLATGIGAAHADIAIQVEGGITAQRQ